MPSLSLWEVNRRIYGRTFRFTATRSDNMQFPTLKPTIYLSNDNFQYSYPYSNTVFHICPLVPFIVYQSQVVSAA